MILQALSRYYDILKEDEDIEVSPYGYSIVEVSFSLEISLSGDVIGLVPLYDLVPSGKKMIERPQRMIVPEQFKHTNKVSAFFLCDNSAYLLGISDKGEQYGKERFSAFREFNIELLSRINCEIGDAVIGFLENYIPDKAQEYPAIANNWEGLLKGGRLVFSVNNQFAHSDTEIKDVWEKHYADSDAESSQCLITGKMSPIARLHPQLKGIKGANSTGAALVSFNQRSFESYNRSKQQGMNSPVSERATVSYSKALNYLLSRANPNKKFFMGDTTIVYWAESENRAVERAFASFVDPSDFEDDDSEKQAARKNADAELQKIADKVKRFQALDLDGLLQQFEEENPRFYILGLSPNAARVSVRFFVTEPFTKIAQNIMAHYRDLEIDREYENQPKYLTVGRILFETVSKNAKDRNAAPLLAGAVFRSILTNTPYPAALYYAIINRIRADMDDDKKKIRKINYARAATIKAFLIRKYRHNSDKPFKEVLIMALNEQSTIPAYLLGRLFAVLERVQIEAIGKNINATIKDRYFTSACASPASVFPILLRLSQHHISKAEYGKAREWEMQEIMDLLDIDQNPIPARLTLDEQGIFVLGYYHQRAFRPKKADQEDQPDS